MVTSKLLYHIKTLCVGCFGCFRPEAKAVPIALSGQCTSGAALPACIFLAFVPLSCTLYRNGQTHLIAIFCR